MSNTTFSPGFFSSRILTNLNDYHWIFKSTLLRSDIGFNTKLYYQLGAGHTSKKQQQNENSDMYLHRYLLGMSEGKQIATAML